MADASTVYASANRMYLATERWVDPDVIAEDGAPAGRSTTIHGFDVSKGDETTYVGSGNVRGYLLNQFSLSEHKGSLRVATTEDPPWFTDFVTEQESESFVTVLDEIDKRLLQVGRVGGLGRGERIYAVRFAGDVGFVEQYVVQVPAGVAVSLTRSASMSSAERLRLALGQPRPSRC